MEWGLQQGPGVTRSHVRTAGVEAEEFLGQGKYVYSLRSQSPCQMMIGVYNHLLSKVFRFHYHSQKVIGSYINENYAPEH